MRSLTNDPRHIHPGEIKSIVYHGSGRQSAHTQFKDTNIVLTTYETLRADWTTDGALYSQKWHRVVLDEGKLAHHPFTFCH